MNKHPRTLHLPWSPGVHSDDRVLNSIEQFYGKEIIITEKMDGENTSLYRDGTVHARSINGQGKPWQDVVKWILSPIKRDIPEKWRIVGENLRARHSIEYKDLDAWFLVFAIFNEKNVALSWTETEEWCELLGLKTVPVLYKGLFTEDYIKNIKIKNTEGYVIRIADCIPYEEWGSLVGKYVRPNHVQTDERWERNWTPNRLKI